MQLGIHPNSITFECLIASSANKQELWTGSHRKAAISSGEYGQKAIGGSGKVTNIALKQQLGIKRCILWPKVT